MEKVEKKELVTSVIDRIKALAIIWFILVVLEGLLFFADSSKDPTLHSSQLGFIVLIFLSLAIMFGMRAVVLDTLKLLKEE